MSKDRMIKQYINAVQKQFKNYHTKDPRFISDLRNAVITFADQTSSLDYKQLISQFGESETLVSDYLAEELPDTRKKKLYFSWHVKIACGVILVLAIVCACVFYFTLDKIHKEEQNSYINREIVILEEDKT